MAQGICEIRTYKEALTNLKTAIFKEDQPQDKLNEDEISGYHGSKFEDDCVWDVTLCSLQ
jgi:hypothetical protein